MDTTRRTYTVAEAAEILGLGRSAAYVAAQRGDLPTLRIGRRVLVPASALEKLLDSAAPRRVSAPDPAQDSRPAA